MTNIFIKGLTIGLAYVAPIGVQNIFIINASLKKSRKQAFYTAFVVAFFDICLSLLCFFGIGTLITAFPILEKIMLIFGGLVVSYIGVSIFRSAPSDNDTVVDDEKKERNIIIDAFVVTFLNPQALIDGTMLFGGNVSSLLISERRFFIMGSASASLLWFFSIATILPFFKNMVSNKAINVINKLCGLYLIYNGLSLLYHFLQIVFI
jgi:L-lysine exporter family protein LysE/ArgO